MSSLITLARPYAKAAFSLAREHVEDIRALGRWQDMLNLASQMAAHADLAAVLDNPLVSTSQAVELLAGAGGEQFDEYFRRFLGVLGENRRLALLPEITALFSRLRQEAENRLQVRVVSAIALDEDQASRMAAALARRFGCTIELQREIDQNVLGGAIVYTGDQVIDGSLRGRVEKLASALSR